MTVAAAAIHEDTTTAEEGNKVTRDVNELFAGTSDVLATAQALLPKIQEVDASRADIDIEVDNAKRAAEHTANDDRTVAAAKALVASECRDMDSRMQELAEAVGCRD